MKWLQRSKIARWWYENDLGVYVGIGTACIIAIWVLLALGANGP